MNEQTDPSRYHVLAVFSFMSMAQCLAWFTYGAIPDSVLGYFAHCPAINTAAIDYSLALGPVGFLTGIPVMLYLRPGLRGAILLGCWLTLSCCVLRMVPVWVADDWRRSWLSVSLIGLAQLLNAFCGCITLGLCSELSVRWFPASERGLATAIAYSSSIVGTVLGFLLLPPLAKHAAELPRALYATLAIAAAPVLGAHAHLPAGPRVAPSALVTAQTGDSGARPGELRAVLASGAFVAVAGSGAMMIGVFSAWQGVLPQVLQQIGYSNQASGVLGFVQAAVSLIAGFAIGPALDRWLMPRLRLAALACLTFLAALFGAMLLALPLPGSAGTQRALTSHSPPYLFTLFTLFGLVFGCLGPILFELGAELTYPASQVLSGSLLMYVLNFGTLVGLVLCAVLRIPDITAITAATCVAAALVTACVPCKYRRQAAQAEPVVESVSASYATLEQAPLLGRAATINY